MKLSNMIQQIMKNNIVKLCCLVLILAGGLNIAVWQNAPNRVEAAAIMEESYTTESAAAPVDYTDKSKWAYYAVGENKSADLFLVCPTVDMGKAGNFNMSMKDEKTKKSFVGALNMERGIYEDKTRLYAPYYRQSSFPVYSLTEEAAEPYFALAYKDVRAAFLQYIQATPPDRPLVLAGFSQGSDMVLRLLKEFFHNPMYQNRLVAAYCIGWRITQEDLEECPWLKLAQKEDDLGTIISFNSEAVDVTESLVVPAGVKTYAVNPLNWRTDSTIAKASENKGACFTDYNSVIKSEVPELTGAYIDKARGTLKLPDIKPEAYANKLFPNGVYHLYDYQFFYRNLQENVSLRITRFCENR